MYRSLFFRVCTVLILLLSLSLPVFAASPQGISAKACVLMLADTREVLYAENENEQLSMASTTKIMTSLLALESGLWEQQIKVTSDLVAAEGTSIGLLPDDLISVRTLISGMLLESGNDAANVTAYAVAGGQAQFLELMNQKAAEIGMKNTHFDSVSGLDTDSHYSTAYDMALLTAYALENPKFRSICSEKSERVYYGNPPYARTLYNHNRLLSSYEGAIGVKTGFTKKSGRCLVSAAERDGVTLIAVTLNAPDDWNDHKKLLDYGFSVVKLCDASALQGDLSVKVVGGDAKTVTATTAYAPRFPAAGDTANVQAQAYLKHFLYAPVEKGETVGSVCYTYNGKVVAQVPLVSTQSVGAVTMENTESPKQSLFHRIWSFFKQE